MSMTDSFDVFDQCELVDLAGLSTEHAFDQRSQDAAFEHVLESLLYTLSPRERQMIEMRFGLNGQEPRTVPPISAEFGFSPSRGYEIINKSLRQMRRSAWHLNDDERQYLAMNLELAKDREFRAQQKKKEEDRRLEAQRLEAQREERQRLKTPTEPLTKNPEFSYMQTQPSEFTLGGYGACRAMPHAEYRPPRDVQSDNISPGWYWQQLCLDIVELRDFTGRLRGYVANMPGPGTARWLSVLRVGEQYFAHQTNGDRDMSIAMSRIENAARVQDSTNTERTHAD